MSKIQLLLKCCCFPMFVALCVVLALTIIICALCNCCCKKDKCDSKICHSELCCKKLLRDKEYICCDESIKELSSDCFAECKKLKRIDFKGDILYIDSSAFNGCENVEEINNIIDLLNTIEETLSPEEIEKDSCQLISLIEKIPEFFQFALMRSKE